MPPRRFRGTPDVTLRVDGEDVPAIRGEPVAVSLAAAGRLVLGRSVKYHRPRGASCYAGRCDGCAMRVDGLPSRPTCRVPAEHGSEVETQNVAGLAAATGAQLDLLAAADWLFPGGMDHHGMFTWSRAANAAMQTVARRVAGVGRLPSEPVPPVAPEEESCDVLVVGAGPSGLSCAAGCAQAGLRTLLLDEEDAPGGHLRFRPGAAPRVEPLVRDAIEAGVVLRPRSAVVGVFDATAGGAVAIAEAPERLVRVRARRVVFAQGRTEGSWAFEGNDLPGVLGSDGALRLLSHGVLPGDRVALAGPGLDDLAEALLAAGARVHGPFALDALVRARGRRAVSGCEVRRGRDVERLPVDAIVVAPPASAAYELAAQAGVEVVFRPEPGSFELVASPDDGATRVPSARVVGRASGVLPSADGVVQAYAAARAIASELGRG